MLDLLLTPRWFALQLGCFVPQKRNAIPPPLLSPPQLSVHDKLLSPVEICCLVLGSLSTGLFAVTGLSGLLLASASDRALQPRSRLPVYSKYLSACGEFLPGKPMI